MAKHKRKKLLIDVDGVTNPYAGNDDELLAAGWRYVPGNPYAIYLPEHGPLLKDFAEEHDFDLVWCTYWNDRANILLSPLYGFGELPVVYCDHGYAGKLYSTIWKYPAVAKAFPDEPIAWLDDEHHDLAWGHYASRREARQSFLGRTAPYHLQAVDPEYGLLKSDLDEIAEWASNL